MNLSRLFDRDLIKLNMKAKSKEDAVDQLVDLFCQKHADMGKEKILHAVRERERLGTTSMGRGVAFPHARTDIVSGLFIIMGVIPEGLEVDTPDDQPLRLVILLLTPRNISRNYLQTLSGLANFVRRPETMAKMLSAKSPQEVIDLIDRSDIEVKKILTVGDVMTHDPITVSPDMTLRDVANLFFQKKIYCAPVVDKNGKVIGEITEAELLKYALPNYRSFIANVANIPEIESFEELLHTEHMAKVVNFMNKRPLTLDVDAPVVEAAALMLFKKATMVCILDDGRLMGIITKTDIVSKIIRG